VHVDTRTKRIKNTEGQSVPYPSRVTSNQERIMNSDTLGYRSLRDIEMEVLAEGREWTRQRLEQELQEVATRQGGAFPPKRRQAVASARRTDASAHRRRSR